MATSAMQTETAGQLTTRPLAPGFGAEVIGVDLSKPLTDATKKAIYDLWIQKGLLLFRGANHDDGMQMRLSLARALIVDPDILLLDEPLSAVDDLLRLRLQEDVSRIHSEQRLTTVLVTHNLQEAAFLSDRVVILGGSPSTPAAEICISEPHPRTPEFRMAPRLFEIVNELTSSLFGGSRLGAPNRSTL